MALNNKHKKILLIGGEGYIGNVLSYDLINDGYQITSYDNLLYNNQIGCCLPLT